MGGSPARGGLRGLLARDEAEEGLDAFGIVIFADLDHQSVRNSNIETEAAVQNLARGPMAINELDAGVDAVLVCARLRGAEQDVFEVSMHVREAPDEVELALGRSRKRNDALVQVQGVFDPVGEELEKAVEIAARIRVERGPGSGQGVGSFRPVVMSPTSGER